MRLPLPVTQAATGSVTGTVSNGTWWFARSSKSAPIESQGDVTHGARSSRSEDDHSSTGTSSGILGVTHNSDLHATRSRTRHNMRTVIKAQPNPFPQADWEESRRGQAVHKRHLQSSRYARWRVAHNGTNRTRIVDAVSDVVGCSTAVQPNTRTRIIIMSSAPMKDGRHWQLKVEQSLGTRPGHAPHMP